MLSIWTSTTCCCLVELTNLNNIIFKPPNFGVTFIISSYSGKSKICLYDKNYKKHKKQEGHDGPVSLHWLIREIHSYQTLHYLGIGLKHKTPYKD